MGCALAPGPAEGTQGAWAALRARLLRAIPGRRRDAAARRPIERGYRRTPRTRGRRRRRINDRPRQGPRAKIQGRGKPREQELLFSR